MSAPDGPRHSTASSPPLPPVRGLGGGRGNRARARGEERPQHTRATLRRLWSYLGRQRAPLTITGCLVAAIVALDLSGPLLLRRAIDRHIVPRQLGGLAQLALLMVGVYASSALLNLAQSHLMAGAAQRTMRDIRADLFHKLQQLPLEFFDRRVHGELMARLTSDVESINQVLSNSVSQLVSGGLTTAAIAITMAVLHPVLGVLAVTTVAGLTIGLNRWLAEKSHIRYREQQSALGRLYGFVEETIGGQKVIKAYGQEPAVTTRFEAIEADYRETAIRAQTVSGFTGPMMNTVNHAALAIVAGVGGLLAIRGSISVGTIATFINYTRQFGRPLNEVANLYHAFQAAMAGAERVFETIDETAEIDAEQMDTRRRIRGDVRFEGVNFAYRRDVPVLKDVTLHARAGQTVALIGPTGAGKTTIVNLLTRFYEINAGRIVVDGVDLREYRKEDLRRQLGIVLQDTFLFSGTVRDNIRYGRLEATDEEVLTAARLANAAAFIERLPLGYDTLLHERGGNFEPRATADVGHRAGHSGRSGHPDPRRGHQQYRHAHRASHSGGHAAPHAGAHQLRHRPPFEHDRERRSDPDDPGRSHRGPPLRRSKRPPARRRRREHNERGRPAARGLTRRLSGPGRVVASGCGHQSIKIDTCPSRRPGGRAPFRVPSLPRGLPMLRKFLLLAALPCGVLAGALTWSRLSTEAAAESPTRAGPRVVTVGVSQAQVRDLPVVLSGLGTVVPSESVNVRSRVTGQLVRVSFREGEWVERGQVLAEVDPREFRARLTQTEGQLDKDRVVLAHARADLERARVLAKDRLISEQEVAAQESLVGQYQANERISQGIHDAAALELGHTRISAPIRGRIGFRQLDVGNNVDATTALAVIHGVEPITVVFTLPEDTVAAVVQELARARQAKRPLEVEAWDKGSHRRLARGKLATIDHQIDASSGTVKLKAEFDNHDGALFPNQFVNVRFVVQVVRDATVIPIGAVQRGREGPFAYVVGKDHVASVRKLELGPTEGPEAVVRGGVSAGELVVVQGIDGVREGSQVSFKEPPKDAPVQPEGTAARASGDHSQPTSAHP
ncbi:MAG: efflux RND transporter periplasmic adaptor subunit [Myxococcales bacterium]